MRENKKLPDIFLAKCQTSLNKEKKHSFINSLFMWEHHDELVKNLSILLEHPDRQTV